MDWKCISVTVQVFGRFKCVAELHGCIDVRTLLPGLTSEFACVVLGNRWSTCSQLIDTDLCLPSQKALSWWRNTSCHSQPSSWTFSVKYWLRSLTHSLTEGRLFLGLFLRSVCFVSLNSLVLFGRFQCPRLPGQEIVRISGRAQSPAAGPWHGWGWTGHGFPAASIPCSPVLEPRFIGTVLWFPLTNNTKWKTFRLVVFNWGHWAMFREEFGCHQQSRGDSVRSGVLMNFWQRAGLTCQHSTGFVRDWRKCVQGVASSAHRLCSLCSSVCGWAPPGPAVQHPAQGRNCSFCIGWKNNLPSTFLSSW